MVRTEDFQFCQQHPAFNEFDLSCRSSAFLAKQQHGFPSITGASTFSTVPVAPSPVLLELKRGHGVNWCPQNLSLLDGSQASRNTCTGVSQPTLATGLEYKYIADDVTSRDQKKFLIFDQSGRQTRLFMSSFCSPVQYTTTASIRNLYAHHFVGENQASPCEQNFHLGPEIDEKLHEDYGLHEESEMHENTEEIDALLYSDDEEDDDNDDADCEDDEVMSSGRSPFTIKGITERDGGFDVMEEVASSYCSTKRQKLLNGECNKLSFGDIPECEDDADSSCANSKNLDTDMSLLMAKVLSRKGKIHDTLRILKGIIPGAKSNDPLLIIDEAISYLKYLRQEASALRSNHS